MLHLLMGNDPWFRSKSHGLGTGLPIAWQGWVLIAAHIALIMGLTLLLRERPLAQVTMALLAAIAPLPLYRIRTEGGWHGRQSGKK